MFYAKLKSINLQRSVAFRDVMADAPGCNKILHTQFEICFNFLNCVKNDNKFIMYVLYYFQSIYSLNSRQYCTRYDTIKSNHGITKKKHEYKGNEIEENSRTFLFEMVLLNEAVEMCQFSYLSRLDRIVERLIEKSQPIF